LGVELGRTRPDLHATKKGSLRWLLGLGAVLCLINAVLILGGFYNLFAKADWEGDLHGRWAEEILVWNGINPFSAWETTTTSGVQPVAHNLHGENEMLSQQVGGYPPWSFVSALILVPPLRFAETRIYFGILNLIALGFCAFAVSRLAQKENAPPLLVAIAVICIVSHAITLRLGQYGILINAFLLAQLLVPQGKYQPLKGLLLALAAIKPQTAGLFFLIPLFRGEFMTIATAAGVLLGETLLFSLWTHSNPFIVLKQISFQSAQYVNEENGLIGLLMKAGVSSSVSILVCFILGLIAACLLIWQSRHCSPLLLFAIAASIGRLWMYHRRYDDCMLVFLFVPLLTAAWKSPTSLLVVSATLLGLSLWLPLREPDQVAFVVSAKIASCVVALFAMVKASPEKPVLTPQPA
jgi:hypothetical protein